MATTKGSRCTITGAPKQRSLTKIKDAFESTFQRDYVNCHVEKQQQVIEPPPADVIPKYACYNGPQESTSKDNFKKPLAETKKELLLDNNSCFQSHFKTEIDSTKQLETGSSTQRDSYRTVTDAPSSLRPHIHSKTHLSETTGQEGNLLGTLDNRKGLSSEYSGIYCQPSPRPVQGSSDQGLPLYSAVASRKNQGNRTARHTVTGAAVEDGTAGGGGGDSGPLSSHRRDYQYRSLPVLAAPPPIPAPYAMPRTVLHGDNDKFPFPPTSNQVSFAAPPPSSPSGPAYQRAQAVARTHQSNFIVGDSRLNSFDRASPRGQPPLDNQSPAGHPPVIPSDMSISHFPSGDLNPARSHARVNYSSTQHYHCRPPPGFFPKHIQGSHLRGESHFQLGSPCPAPCGEGALPCPAQSTMTHTYQPPGQALHYVRSRPVDSIDFNYRGPDQYMSTTSHAHRPLPRAREKPNPEVIKKLKQSHWTPPLPVGGDLQQDHYRSIHRACFQHPRGPPRGPPLLG